MANYKNAFDYANQMVVNDIRLHRGVETCTQHPSVPATREWIIREQGFTEYDPMCEACYTAAVTKKMESFVSDVFCKTMYCEACHTEKPMFTRLVDGSYDENLHVYKDVEDHSWTDMCTECYQKQVRTDIAVLAEDEQLADLEDDGPNTPLAKAYSPLSLPNLPKSE